MMRMYYRIDGSKGVLSELGNFDSDEDAVQYAKQLENSEVMNVYRLELVERPIVYTAVLIAKLNVLGQVNTEDNYEG